MVVIGTRFNGDKVFSYRTFPTQNFHCESTLQPIDKATTKQFG